MVRLPLGLKFHLWHGLLRVIRTSSGYFESHVLDSHHGSGQSPKYGIDELEKAGLHALPCEKIKPVRVAEAPWSLECELQQLVDVGERGSAGSSVLIIGKILIAHRKTGVWKPLSRLGGPWYGSTQNFRQLERAKKID